MTDFYKRIDELLKKQKKSKDDLAKMLGLSSVQVFYNWKNLKKIPDMNTAFLIANFLNTSIEYLVTGEEKDIYKEKYENLKIKIKKALDDE